MLNKKKEDIDDNRTQWSLNKWFKWIELMSLKWFQNTLYTGWYTYLCRMQMNLNDSPKGNNDNCC